MYTMKCLQINNLISYCEKLEKTQSKYKEDNYKNKNRKKWNLKQEHNKEIQWNKNTFLQKNQ